MTAEVSEIEPPKRVGRLSRSWSKVRRLITMSRTERRWLVRAWFSMIRIDRSLASPDGRRVLLSSVPAVADRAKPAPSPERLAALVAVAARHHFVPARCLHRAICLRGLLAQAGQAAELKIGVRREEVGLDAHAWVEIDGEALAEPPPGERRYASLDSMSKRP